MTNHQNIWPNRVSWHENRVVVERLHRDGQGNAYRVRRKRDDHEGFLKAIKSNERGTQARPHGAGKSGMTECRYYGRDFTAVEVTLIAASPPLNRHALSKEFCRRIGWFKPDGGLKDMMTRVTMLAMHNDGLITLPPPRGSWPLETTSSDGRHSCARIQEENRRREAEYRRQQEEARRRAEAAGPRVVSAAQARHCLQDLRKGGIRNKCGFSVEVRGFCKGDRLRRTNYPFQGAYGGSSSWSTTLGPGREQSKPCGSKGSWMGACRPPYSVYFVTPGGKWDCYGGEGGGSVQ